MADTKSTPKDDAAPAAQEQEKARVTSEPTPDLQMDETVPGGKYRTQAGEWVNAEGQPISGS